MTINQTRRVEEEDDIPVVQLKKEKLAAVARKYLLENSVDDYLQSDLFRASFVTEKSSRGETLIRRRTEEDG